MPTPTMQNFVTQRFIECHNYLLESSDIRSSRQFALRIKYQPQSLNEILNGRRDVPLKVIHHAVNTFNLNPTFLFTGDGHFLLGVDSSIDQQHQNESEKNRITYVGVSAQAGYGGQLDEVHYGNDLETFTLPGHEFKVGTFRCFDVDGDSMEPLVQNGDKLVCSKVELDPHFSCIRNNKVYIVVTAHDIVVKRLLKVAENENILELHSDNSFFKTYTLRKSEILEIWAVKMKISRFHSLQSNNNSLTEELDSLRSLVQNQSGMINDLNLTIDKLLKVSRSRN